MASIDIQHPHSKTPAQARKAVESMAKKLAERFDMDYGWDGDTLNFSRSGVDGKIALLADKLRVTANLGFLLSAMKGPIEQEIRRVLSEKFD
ncbi:polyhydroxyalkanoic acid system family protein [Pseudoxanthomonas japonensis]|jgi:putative polyhydroxyalkanoate system protein|uniref:Polyhydroxyalkanoic acid synthase n=1 Tax=Pseudoxanthomonas japonensis TaxID=69284 RepID=A0ABQ6ZGE6_9GAMM|nr:polyhydroxyalkanoic acid system family protein [Pseudoxanthomonas japonensis]KAF1724800.1 polyhydroxyalkanoic acid synthase [Pseudoxanthomonas japonensis]MCR6627919.1 polyhydroxyalkanoic acid system family protein [Pseudoxanthomonas sp.]NCT72280.1 polyhydroxyalkanoic acid synthase [Xanthomonadaceae bacterium]